jgi:hypothetical protein
LKANLSYIARPCLKKTKRGNKWLWRRKTFSLTLVGQFPLIRRPETDKNTKR